LYWKSIFSDINSIGTYALAGGSISRIIQLMLIRKRGKQTTIQYIMKKTNRRKFIKVGIYSSLAFATPVLTSCFLNEKSASESSIIKTSKVATIINTASGGLSKPDKFDSELIHFVTQIPYDWIFPKTYGVIHHGGSGTTHLALKYGCATMIIPHIIDQFVWNKIIYNMGAGPKGVKISKITTKNLEPKILELVNNTSFKKKAQEVASQMEKEDLREELYNAIVE
jgi:hypothetical protein